MDFHPILEVGVRPSPGLWYVAGTLGDRPSGRVGHGAVWIAGRPGSSAGRIYVVGGADPSAAYADLFVLDLGTFGWDAANASAGFRARYEHALFVPESQPTKIHVFGGALQSSNYNDVQVFDVVDCDWKSVSPSGPLPSPRTYHTQACTADRFVVFSGGMSGTEPVGDRKVHLYHSDSATWEVVDVRGVAPKPRHGHSLQKMDNSRLVLFGGMSGPTFYSDVHVLDVDAKTWRLVKCARRSGPAERAAHAAAVFEGAMYIFGGMNKSGALHDVWKFHFETEKWCELHFDGAPPQNRLDMACCVAWLKVPPAAPYEPEQLLAAGAEVKTMLDTRFGSASLSLSNSSSAASSRVNSASAVSSTKSCCSVDEDLSNLQLDDSEVMVPVFVVIGGMDTEGEIFDDCILFALK